MTETEKDEKLIFETKEQNGILFITAGDREFSVNHHPGRDATRTRRQVKKLIMPQVAQIADIRQRAYTALSADDKARYDELADQIDALNDGEVKTKLSKEADILLSKHEEAGAIAKASANISALLDLDQEDLLDALVFKHTKARVGKEDFKRLSDDSVFDRVFSGKYCNLVEKIREEIISFNGFLDQ